MSRWESQSVSWFARSASPPFFHCDQGCRSLFEPEVLVSQVSIVCAWTPEQPRQKHSFRRTPSIRRSEWVQMNWFIWSVVLSIMFLHWWAPNHLIIIHFYVYGSPGMFFFGGKLKHVKSWETKLSLDIFGSFLLTSLQGQLDGYIAIQKMAEQSWWNIIFLVEL